MADFLATLRDVNLSGLVDGSVGIWNATARQWRPLNFAIDYADNNAAWLDGSGTMQASFSSSYRYREVTRFGSRVLGTYHITCNGSGAYTAGSVAITLPYATNAGYGETVIGTWHQSGTGGATWGILVASYSSTTCYLKTTGGAHLTSSYGASGIQLVANFHYGA